MDKRISIKTIYLLLVISIGLIGLGVGSTYAVFTARAEIDNPIVINSNLTHDSEVVETIEIEVPAKEVITSTLNISNTSGSNLNYSIWFIDEGEVVFLDTVSSTGSLISGGSTSVNLNILNKEDRDVIVNVGISSSPYSIVLGSDMKKIDEEKAYAVYSEDDNSLSFYRTSDIISIGNTYNNKSVTNVYTGFETFNYENGENVPWYNIRESVENVVIYDEIYPISTAYWFHYTTNCNNMNLTKLYTTNVNSMLNMFSYSGYNTSSYKLVGLNDWDVSNVTSMRNLFSSAGFNATEWYIGDLSNWNTSNVWNMQQMFLNAGLHSNSWSIGTLKNWDTSNVIAMHEMFYNAGFSNLSTFNLDLSNWDVSSVTTMQYMFAGAGRNSTESSIGNISNWDTSNVTNMNHMFSGFGTYNTSLIELDLSGWDTSNVIDMSNMFSNAINIKTIYVSDKWNTNAVANSDNMFYGCTSLVGGSGTTYNSSYVDKTYARIDGGTSSPGYLTLRTTE